MDATMSGAGEAKLLQAVEEVAIAIDSVATAVNQLATVVNVLESGVAQAADALFDAVTRIGVAIEARNESATFGWARTELAAAAAPAAPTEPPKGNWS